MGYTFSTDGSGDRNMKIYAADHAEAGTILAVIWGYTTYSVSGSYRTQVTDTVGQTVGTGGHTTVEKYFLTYNLTGASIPTTEKLPYEYTQTLQWNYVVTASGGAGRVSQQTTSTVITGRTTYSHSIQINKDWLVIHFLLSNPTERRTIIFHIPSRSRKEIDDTDFSLSSDRKELIAGIGTAEIEVKKG